jgi:phage gpG-like protein
LREKRENRQILKILQATGRLRASINYQADESSVAVGSNMGYAPKHQRGIGVYRREYLGISDADEAAIVDIIQDYILS